MTNDDSPAWNEEARITCQFRFKCPQVWDRLQPTQVEGVRHCPECQRDVHLALTEEDFRKHSDEVAPARKGGRGLKQRLVDLINRE